MTRSVEIPDAAVEAAHAKYYEGAYQLLQSASRTAMRAALVAARPYLMPEREAMYWAISEASERQGVDKFLEEEDLDAFVTAILALTNGES